MVVLVVIVVVVQHSIFCLLVFCDLFLIMSNDTVNKMCSLSYHTEAMYVSGGINKSFCFNEQFQRERPI